MRTLYNNVIFIDYKQAFDSVRQPGLWQVMRHYRIPERLVRLITLHYIFSVHIQSRPRTADITMSHNEWWRI